MATAAVSSPSIFQELQSFYQSRQVDLKQLGSDLQSGNLSAAQQDYSTLVTLGQGGPFANSEPFSKSGRAQAFETIGQDLQSGDLAGAQAAFTTLTSSQSSSATSSQTPAASTPTATTAASASSIYQQLQAYQQQRQADVTQLGQDLQSGNLTAAQTDFNTLTTLGQSGPNKNGQPFQEADRAQDFQTIGQALQTGNLSLAQSAFASLTGKFSVQSQQAQTAISAYNSNADSNAVEIVINLGGASSTSASNASASGTAAGTTPEIVINVGEGSNSSSGSSSASEIVINLGAPSSTSTSSTTASSTATTPEIVINLGEGNGASSSASSATSSANPEEITINLGSSSGAQITIDGAQGQNGNAAEQVINFNPQASNNYELILNVLNSSLTTQSTSSNALSVSA
jgi:hypothetical protein